MVQPRTTVGHIVPAYLGLSETFIYSYLTHFQRTRPIVLTARAQNLDHFPLDAIHVPDLPRRAALIDRVSSRLIGRRPALEKAYTDRSTAEQVALLHAHFGPSGVLGLSIKRHLNVPLVTTFYGDDMSAYPRQRRWRAAYQKLFQNGDLFLVEGSHMADRLRQLGCPPEKIEVQHIAIDVARYLFRPRQAPIDGSPLIVLMCGRLVEKKGFEYGLEAFARLSAVCPSVELRIIGDGPLRSSIERQIQHLDLQTQVHLLGYQNHQQVLHEADRAHLFMSPSVTGRDGSTEGGAPTVLLEMQAMGLPILSTYHADISEVVCDKQSGYLSPERDVETLAQHLISLARQPETWPALGHFGRSHVAAHYEISVCAPALERRYAKLIELQH